MNGIIKAIQLLSRHHNKQCHHVNKINTRKSTLHISESSLYAYSTLYLKLREGFLNIHLVEILCE